MLQDNVVLVLSKGSTFFKSSQAFGSDDVTVPHNQKKEELHITTTVVDYRALQGLLSVLALLQQNLAMLYQIDDQQRCINSYIHQIF